MATLAISITTGAGTTTSSKTFSGADSTRILAAYQQQSRNPAAGQQEVTNFLMDSALDDLKQMVRRAESTTPADPAFS